jgi:hypothetical protein
MLHCLVHTKNNVCNSQAALFTHTNTACQQQQIHRSITANLQLLQQQICNIYNRNNTFNTRTLNFCQQQVNTRRMFVTCQLLHSQFVVVGHAEHQVSRCAACSWRWAWDRNVKHITLKDNGRPISMYRQTTGCPQTTDAAAERHWIHDTILEGSDDGVWHTNKTKDCLLVQTGRSSTLGRNYCLHFQGRRTSRVGNTQCSVWRIFSPPYLAPVSWKFWQLTPPKRRLIYTRIHGVTSDKTARNLHSHGGQNVKCRSNKITVGPQDRTHHSGQNKNGFCETSPENV